MDPVIIEALKNILGGFCCLGFIIIAIGALVALAQDLRNVR